MVFGNRRSSYPLNETSIMSAVRYKSVYMPPSVGDWAERQLIAQGIQLAVRDLLADKPAPFLPEGENTSLSVSVAVTLSQTNEDGSKIFEVEVS